MFRNKVKNPLLFYFMGSVFTTKQIAKHSILKKQKQVFTDAMSGRFYVGNMELMQKSIWINLTDYRNNCYKLRKLSQNIGGGGAFVLQMTRNVTYHQYEPCSSTRQITNFLTDNHDMCTIHWVIKTRENWLS